MANLDAEFEKTVQFLYVQLPMFQRDGASAYKKDLTNTIRLCEYLDNPQHKFKSVHVAGTNGKGSSCHYLAAVCQQAGYKTGLYTSPHLKSFTERIKINGKDIDKQAVVDFVNRIKPLMEEIKPSFFEITVAMCFDYFARNNVDIAIIEVGMGGRLDSTNVILPVVSLITNISKDHQQWLGNTIEEIAQEKAGIIKHGTPAFIGEKQNLDGIFKKIASEKQAPLHFAMDDYDVKYDQHFDVFYNGKKQFEFKDDSGAVFQCNNLPGVLKTIELLNEKGFVLDSTSIRIGLENAFLLTGLRGRWQKLNERPLMFCDVGHNEAGISQVLRQIQLQSFNMLHMVLGMVNDKDIDPVLAMLPKDAQYYFCQAKIPRALDSKVLKQKAEEFDLKGIAISDVNEAIAHALTTVSSDDFIFIGGSNFVVAEIEGL